MNIVILTSSGIPSFDYSLPLIYKLRKNKKIDNVYLLSNKLNSASLFPNFSDSNNVLLKTNITSIDLSDMSLFRYIKILFSSNSRNSNRKGFLQKLIKLVEKKIIKKFNLTIKTLEKISPNIVLFDHRDPSTIDSYSKIFEYFNQNKIKVFLLPHAPHYLNESEHLSTGLNEELLINVSYIEPFAFSKVDPQLTNKYFSVENIGYPGFEEGWIEFIKRNPTYTDSLILLLRPFHTKDSRWSRNEKVVLSEDELEKIILSTNMLIEKNMYKNVIIKPHPKNFQSDLDRILKPNINHENIIFYHESIINLISESNTFISTYSTTLLTTIAGSCKTYIINTQIFDKVFNDWKILKDLYSNFSGFTDPEEILNVDVDVRFDKIHLQKFFKPNYNDLF